MRKPQKKASGKIPTLLRDRCYPAPDSRLAMNVANRFQLPRDLKCETPTVRTLKLNLESTPDVGVAFAGKVRHFFIFLVLSWG